MQIWADPFKPFLQLLFLFFVPLVLLCFITSCLSPAIKGWGFEGGAPSAGIRPLWINTYPSDPGYYIGIGSSNTGNQGEDMELARAKALSSLASAISTTIQSEQTVTSWGSNTGPGFESVELVIKETVNQNLKNIEVVDSYYSAQDGYWFYLRLNKAEWNRIQEEEVERLASRIEGILLPVLNNPGETAAGKIASIVQSSDIALASPYASSARVRVSGESGAAADILRRLYRSYMETLSVSCNPSSIIFEEGDTVNLSFQISSGKSERAGVFRLVLLNPKGDLLYTFDTDELGRYRGGFTFPSLPLGHTDLLVSVDASSIKSPLEPDLLTPKTRVSVDKSARRVKFLFRSADDNLGSDAEGSAKALLSRILQVKLLGEEEPARYSIQFSLYFRDAPDNSYGLFINYAKAIISVLQDGRPVWTYESEEIKTGGLNTGQARATASKKLMETLDQDTKLRQELAGVFSGR